MIVMNARVLTQPQSFNIISLLRQSVEASPVQLRPVSASVSVPRALTTDTWFATVTLTTRLGSELCPVWVLERYGEAIASQAAHLIAMRGQIGVTEMSVEYRAAVQEAIARKAIGGSVLSSGPASAISDSIERI